MARYYLTMPKRKDPEAVERGRLGGQVTGVKKGFAALSKADRRKVSKRGGEATGVSKGFAALSKAKLSALSKAAAKARWGSK